MISSKASIYGIRPVLNIKKSLLVADSGVIPITDIITNGTRIDLEYDKTLYDGFLFKFLQGFTTTKDKLVFMCTGSIKENSVMNSYYLNNLSKLYKREYNKTGHGNGMTYNSKTNKVLLVGPDSNRKVFEYNGETLEKEKEYSYPTYPKSTSIGYNYDNDLYIGNGLGGFFLLNSTDFKKLYEFSYFTFETGQDLEYYNGYIFDCLTNVGVVVNYQSYSFYNYLDNIIYVYNVKLDKNNNPTKNFGRLTARLIMSGLGELESISFRDGYVYLGFNINGAYTFYKFKYKKLTEKIKIQLKILED